MKAEVMGMTDMATLPVVAVLIFFGVFLGALFMVLRPGAKAIYERRAMLVLNDGKVVDGGLGANEPIRKA